MNGPQRFFTVKRVIILLIAVFFLVAICSPRHEPLPEDGGACGTACPLPTSPSTITVPEVRFEEVTQENWRFDLPGTGWESKDSSNPSIKVMKRNLSQECMVLLIKEQTNLAFSYYAIESIKGFSLGGKITAIKQTMFDNQKFILVEGTILDNDIFLSWNTIKDGFGYSFTCFYSPNVDAGSVQYDLCVEIAESLQIK
jgi:hypothetical protein